MQEPVRREAIAQAPDQIVGADALGRTERRRIPFLRLIVVDRDEGRLAAHGQPDVVRHQVGVDLFSERVERRPGFVGERIGDARLLRDAGDLHVEEEGDVRRLDGAADRRRGAEMRRGGERKMTLAAQQSRGRVEPDPTGARHVGLGPGVQVGEVLRRADRPVERLHVRPQLDEIARHEARREPEVPQGLHQQPGAVAAGAGSSRQRLFRRLHAGFHANEIADVALQTLIELDQEIDGVAAIARDRGEERRQAGSRRLGVEIGPQLLRELGGIGERKAVGERLDEEVERIDHRHVGQEIDGDGELAGLLRKHEARQPVSVRVLLPIHEMLGRRHLERIAHDAGAAVRRRPQPDDLGPEPDRPIVLVPRDMMETGEDRHGYAAPMR